MAARLPSLAVLTVTCNDRTGLAATRASLSAQTHRPDAWLVQDGGSTDGSQADLAAWARAGPPAPAWTSQADRGPFDAMNRGWRRVAAEWVLVLNAGDVLADPTVLADLRDSLAAVDSDVAIVMGASFMPDGRGGWRRKPARPPAYMRLGMPAEHQAMAMRCDAVAGLAPPPFPEAYAIAGDYALLARLVAAGWRVRRLARAITRQRQRGLSARHAARGRREQAAIQRAILGRSAAAVALPQVLKAFRACWGLR